MLSSTFPHIESVEVRLAASDELEYPLLAQQGFRRFIVLKLTLLVGVLVALTAIAIGGVAYQFTHQTLRQQIQERLSVVASERQAELLGYIRGQEARIALVANRTGLRDLLAQHATQKVDEAVFVAEMRRKFLDVVQSSPTFLSISVTDLNGRVLASTDDDELGQDYSSRPEFLAGRQERFLGLPTYQDNQYRSWLSSPIVDENSQPLGVMLVLLDTTPMANLLSNKRGLDRTGRVVVATNINDQAHYLFQPETPPVDLKKARIMNRALAGERGDVEDIDGTGTMVLASYRPVGYSDWGLVAKITASEAYAPIDHLRGLFWRLLGAVLLIGVLTSYLLARQFSRPILRMAQAAKSVADGNLEVQVPVKSRDELGLLSAAFNDMIGQLHATRNNLEQRVANRTKQLAHSEGELRQHTRILKAILDNIGDGVVVSDDKGKFLIFNPAAKAILKLGQMDVAREDWTQTYGLFLPDRVTPFPPDEIPLARAIRGESTNSVEMFVHHDELPDGAWISVTGRPLKDDSGALMGGVVVFRDITALKQALDALHASAARRQQVVDTAYDAFVAMDEKGRIIDWNPQAKAIFGWPPEEIIGQLVSETIIPEQYRAAHQQGLDRFLKTGEGPVLNRRLELTALHRDGHEFPIEFTITSMPLNGGHLFNAFLHDISDRKRAEAELREAKEAAEAASQAKSLFLANMSHEIRTPMNAIIGMTDLVLEGSLTSEQREYLTLVQASTDSLLAVINDILDFSKIEAGRLDLESLPFNLRESLGDAMKALAFRARHKQLELACHINPDVPDTVAGDPTRLRQVVTNLVGNAIKFTERGEVVLDVSVDALSSDAVGLHFRVRDTGPGIPAHLLTKIFEAFEQADTSTTRRFGGTGLGLTISARLVELMGGHIWAESEVGSGSTFHFTARFTPVSEAVLARRAHPAKLTGLPVLVVDDNETNRRILVEMLEGWNTLPTAVVGASEALAALRQAHQSERPFALILTDSQMPDMDGFELANRIRQDKTLGEPVIMMLTSGDQTGDIDRCQLLGISAYLIKPIKSSELFNSLLTVLGISTAADEASAKAVATIGPTAPRRILLVEDSQVNQHLMLGLLKNHGHEVVIANNGREGIDRAVSQAFDLVLMDVQMPEMDGLEATVRIREHEKQTGGHVRIVAMTAHAMKGDRERCLAAGMDGYLSKPVRARDLYEAINHSTTVMPTAGATHDATPSTDQPCDWSVALNTVQGDRQLLHDMVEAMVQECPRMLAEMDQGLAEGDAVRVQRAAHTIKASMRYMGAAQARNLAEKLETCGRTGDLASAAPLVQPLKQELGKLLPIFEDFLRSGHVPV